MSDQRPDRVVRPGGQGTGRGLVHMADGGQLDRTVVAQQVDRAPAGQPGHWQACEQGQAPVGVEAAREQVGCLGQEGQHADPAFLDTPQMGTAERQRHPTGDQLDPFLEVAVDSAIHVVTDGTMDIAMSIAMDGVVVDAARVVVELAHAGRTGGCPAGGRREAW